MFRTSFVSAAIRRTALLFLTFGFCASLRADPLINLTLEGRKLGSDAEFSANLDVDPGDVIEYRLRADVAPIGTSNLRLTGPVTIEELIPGRDGINSLSVLSLFQSSSDGIQTDFDGPATLVNDWDKSISARGGMPGPREGSPWNDLVSVRPARGPGLFSAIDPETAFQGTFSVAQVSGPFANIDIGWTHAFGMKINNGRTYFPGVAGAAGEDPTDPGVGFVPLTLTSPFDIGEKSITVDYDQPDASPAELLREQIISGRGGPGIGNGTWTGRGITSNAAAAENAVQPEAYSVGYADNADLPMGALKTLDEKILDTSEVLIRFTRTGDANLDGIVNDEDATILSANYAPGVHNPHWSLGDFDYNGFVDDADATLLGALYNPTAAPLATSALDGTSVAAVPEPSAVVLFAIASLGGGVGIGLRRRKRRRLVRACV